MVAEKLIFKESITATPQLLNDLSGAANGDVIVVTTMRLVNTTATNANDVGLTLDGSNIFFGAVLKKSTTFIREPWSFVKGTEDAIQLINGNGLLDVVAWGYVRT